MPLENYHKFIDDPNTKTLNTFLESITELRDVQKITKPQLVEIKKKIIAKHLINDKLYIKEDRKGPLFSATCFPTNFILVTKNKVWKAVRRVNSQVWQMIGDFDYQQNYIIKNEEVKLNSFVLDKKILHQKYRFRDRPENKFSLYRVESQLYLPTGRLSIGEIDTNVIVKVPSGYYNIYYLSGSLLIAPANTKPVDIFKRSNTWKFFKTFGVDVGQFGCHDAYLVEHMESEFYIHDNDSNCNVFMGKDMANSDLKNDKIVNYIKKYKLNDKAVGIMCRNREGDGLYNIYRNGNMFLLTNNLFILFMMHIQLHFWSDIKYSYKFY